MRALIQDVQYALRVLAKSPGFALVAILTLALGIGANTAIFSVINSVLLEPLPFKNPAQLVDLRETESAPGHFPLDGADYLDWQAQNSTFSSMSLYSFPRGQNASTAGGAESAAVAATQANFFETLGVAPVLGRAFAIGEDQGTHQVAILSYGFWQRHYGGAPTALGKTLSLDDEPYTVIGVMPRWLNFPADTDLFIPLDMTSAMVHNRGDHWARGLGRLKNGVSPEQGRADLLTISARLNKQYRAPNDQAIHSLVFPLKEWLTGTSRPQLLLLFGAVTLVLLTACANVANLLLARSAGRRREMTLRAALGAGRWRLLRQLLTESTLLSFCGAALGALGAWWGVAILQSSPALRIASVNPVQVNLMVLLFTAGVSVLVGILFGLAPALQGSAPNLSENLKSSASAAGGAAGGGRILRDVLIIAETAVCLALLVGSGLLLRSFAKMSAADIGVRPDNILTMAFNPPPAKYSTVASQREFIAQLLDRVQRIPGITSAAVSSHLPLRGGSNGYIQVPGITNPALANQLVEVHWITPDYFRVFGIPLIEGRTFTEEDSQRFLDAFAVADAIVKSTKGGAPQFPPSLSFPVVINQAMAKTFWPHQDPLGKAFNNFGGGLPWRVIGVVGDVKQHGIRDQAAPERYFPITAGMGAAGINYGFGANLVVKTAVPPRAVLPSIQREMTAVDASVALFHVRTMRGVIAEKMQDTTAQAFLLGIFASLALLLVAVGLYGVISYVVSQRTREIGIRMALGAQHRDVFGMVLWQGSQLLLSGLAIGTAGALGLTQLLSASLFGVTATDPLTFIAAAAVLAAIALLACYIPARRAMRVDPMVALRYE